MKFHQNSRILEICLILAVVRLIGIPFALGEVSYDFVDKWGTYGSGDGQFNFPNAIIADSSGYLYVSDHKNHRVQKFDTDGNFIDKWGQYGNGDGEFNLSVGIVIDSLGFVYVGDRYNHRIQKFDTDGNFIGWWGGCDDASHSGSGHWHNPGSGHNPQEGSGNGQFIHPTGVAIDSSDNIYIADSGNHRIQKFTSTGGYLTQWGHEGTGNGEFNIPYGVCVDSSGDVFVTDTYNDRIQKFTSDGTFLDKWGQYGKGDGDLYFPHGIQVDSANLLYVVEMFNNRIQVFSTFGDYITKWGSYGSGDGQFSHPIDIAFDSFGYVYVTDQNNNRVQKFQKNTAPADIEWIMIMTECEHVDGVEKTLPWDFEIEVSVLERGALHHIDVIKPGETIASHTFLEEEANLWVFDPPKYPSLEALRADFPEGIYTLELRDFFNTLLTTVSLDYSGLSEPACVDFTYPSVNGQTDVSVNPTFEWTIEHSDGDVLALGIDDVAMEEQVYGAWPESITTESWNPGPLLPSRAYELDVSVSRVVDWVGPDMPTMTVEGDEFAYILTFDCHNEITFTTESAPSTLSGLVLMASDGKTGYSLDENDLIYIHSFEFVGHYNVTTEQWVDYEPVVSWIYIDWPFYYVFDTSTLMFAWPPESGIYVYHNSTGQWMELPRTIP